MKEQKIDEESPEPDFYWENGLMVFTRSYHLKRGYCCNSGCRHCPYKKPEDGSRVRGRPD